MDVAEFDLVADEYDRQLRGTISITGEGPEYFAEYKIRELKRIADKSDIEPATILDFGSGIGNSIPYFKKYFPKAALTSADVSSRSLELSGERFPNSNLMLIDEQRIPADELTFDVAFSACVFHHIPHEEHVHWLSEIRRVTKPDGLIVIVEHNPLNPLTVNAVNTCPFDKNAVIIRARDMGRRLQKAGWRHADTRYIVFFPRRLSGLRPIEPLLSWFPVGAQYMSYARN